MYMYGSRLNDRYKIINDRLYVYTAAAIQYTMDRSRRNEIRGSHDVYYKNVFIIIIFYFIE
jgi:hypothetical protein